MLIRVVQLPLVQGVVSSGEAATFGAGVVSSGRAAAFGAGGC